MTSEPYHISPSVYCVGGPNLSHNYDCLVYLIVGDRNLILVDSGAGVGNSFGRIISNIEWLGFQPENLKFILVTHEHIDHIGALTRFKEHFQSKIVAHSEAVSAIQTADLKRTAADYYGVDLKPCKVDIVLPGSAGMIIEDPPIYYLHTPGHTPGSVVFYFNDKNLRVLFGHDIHGPFNARWDSDKTLWRASLRKLLDLEADILCEGHYGVFEGEKVKEFITSFLQ
ncbi:MAG: MBL fold metallo-hydrolase [Candidatus Hodarchaeota archaeon]